MLVGVTSKAHNNVVVVPLGGTEKPGNVITVAHKNGDFKTLAAAMDSIDDASDENRYLIVIGPGVYKNTPAITVKKYVAVQGSGTEWTKLIGDVTGLSANEDSALITLDDETRISNLTIQNEGSAASNSYRIGLATTSLSSGVRFIDSVEIVMLPGGFGAVHGVYIDGGFVYIEDVHARFAQTGDSVSSAVVFLAGGQAKINNLTTFSSFAPGLKDSATGFFSARYSSFYTGVGVALSIANDISTIYQSRLESGTVNDTSAEQNCSDILDRNLSFVSC